MNILFCTPQPISHYLGISRVLIDIKDQLEELGHNVDLIGPIELGMTNTNFASNIFRREYTEKLKDYLIANSKLYDVVDYDHEFLPFDRSLFNRKTLFVARTVLLVQHTKFIKPKKPWSLRSTIGSILRYRQFSIRLNDSWKTLVNADLINVPNEHDKARLINMGIKADKVVVIPFGLSPERLKHFEMLTADTPKIKKICFLGTFDYRKGASLFGQIFSDIRKSNPETRLLLLGCGGLFSNRDSILKFFKNEDHDHIETVFKFQREEIGLYLKDCSLGLYPSYMEGFPFGILEMLLAYIPVVAFDAPGASMMLDKEDLVDVEDQLAMVNWILKLLSDNDQLIEKRMKSHEKALSFTWEFVAQKTIEAYRR